MQLVEVKRNEIYVDSKIVADKFDYKHAYVARIIKNILKDLSKITVTRHHPKALPEFRNYRGTEYTVYLMNREFFTLLVMRMKGEKAFNAQIMFNNAFYAMEDKLTQLSSNKNNPEWLEARIQSKIARLDETDVIKNFIEYATAQGSKSPNHYYKHFTNMGYVALGFITMNRPKLRDTLGFIPLCELVVAERMIKDLLVKYMKLGRHYKDIYQSIKEDLTKFAKALHMGQIEHKEGGE